MLNCLHKLEMIWNMVLRMCLKQISLQSLYCLIIPHIRHTHSIFIAICNVFPYTYTIFTKREIILSVPSDTWVYKYVYPFRICLNREKCYPSNMIWSRLGLYTIIVFDKNIASPCLLLLTIVLYLKYSEREKNWKQK